VKSVTSWFQAIHALVVGPGLGRDSFLWECTSEIIQQAKSKNIPIVIDGDGLNLVCSQPGLIKGYQWAILTPNVVEFKRLCDAVKLENISVQNLAHEFGNVTIVQKGFVDVISNGKDTVECKQEGSPRRCGGQGDMLSGTLAAFVAWASEWSKGGKSAELPSTLLACFAACSLSKHASHLAFQKHKRSTTTPDMIQELGNAFETLFPENFNVKL